ncbi:MAG: response regulator transcription factor [Oscillospiraceae bacterium]|nr:response regulator transcription factor [Oscillospiraceae bacterium]
MEQPCVLICDDNIAVHTSLSSYFKAEQMQVLFAYEGKTALDLLRSQGADAVILDLMLPDMDGLEVLREIRKFDESIHILILSARGSEVDRVVGLELGADDYVTKPYSPREVVLRVKKALRRKSDLPSVKALTLAELTVQPEQYRVFVSGQEIKLSAKEIDVLALLLSNVSKVVTREQLLNAAWGYEYFGDTRVVDAMIKRLRQKLAVGDTHFQISTVYGVGYKIEECP